MRYSVEQIARVAHETNRGFCQAIGDWSQIEWDNAPNWQRESMISGVKDLVANPALTAVDLHERWRATKQSEGWIYGEVKDSKSKTHPCMVPYDDLPPVQRSKNDLFRVVALTLLA